jgi:subtilase family serine protease
MLNMLLKNRSLRRFLLYIVGIFIFFMYISPCLATYNFEGTPEEGELVETTSGTVKGGLYVDGGQGLGQTPYVQEFNVPGDSVTWAKVYVGVWGGTEVKTGTMDLTVNGKEFESFDLEGTADKGDDEDQNPAIYCAGHGVYWIAYDLGTNLSTGPVTVEAKTGGDIDGRIYGIVLAAVYEDKEGQDTKYWVEEGNVNLHGKGWSGDQASTHDEAYADFSGKVDAEKYSNANLAVVYLCGSPGLDDSLYFNDEQLSDGENQNDIANSKSYFDFKFFDVLDFLEEDDNELKFQRDDEDYVHPVLATLSLGTEEEGSSDLIVSGLTLPVLYAGQDNTIKATLKNIGQDSAYGFQAALYADDEIVSTASVSSLSSEKSKTIDFNWKPERSGKQVLKVYVDYTNKKKELCEINNWNTPFLANVVDLTPPEVKIEFPADGSSVASGYLTVSGTVEDTSKNLTVDVNGQKALLADGGWNADIPIVSGPNKIVVSAVDETNNTGKEFLVVTGTSSRSDNNESFSSGSEKERVHRTVDTEPISQTLVVSQNKGLEKAAVFPELYAELGIIFAALFLRSQNRRKQS